MKFRIAHKEGVGYFAHVKKSWFTGWKRIASLDNDLYDYNLYKYPQLRREESIDIINRYKKHIASKDKETFTEVK